MVDEIICEISVCTDCMFEHANGEIDPDRPADSPPVWGLIKSGESVAMGGTHRDDCPNHDKWIGADCDCDELGFCTTSCDGCGDYLHGDRYRFTLWAKRPASS